MNNEYKVSSGALIIHLGIMGIFSVVTISLLIRSALDPSDGENWPLILWALIMLGTIVPFLLRTPHTIILDVLGRLTFKSFFMERVFPVNLLHSIGTRYLNTQYLYFQFDNRTVKVINSVDNLSELITKVKTINANIKTRGC